MAGIQAEKMFGRFLFSGISYGELAATMARWQASDDWYNAWFQGAERLAGLAQRAAGEGQQTAQRCWLEASAMYHFAQFHLFADTAEKRLAQDCSALAYLCCAPTLSPRSESLNFTVDGIRYTGYFRTPQPLTPRPCIILLNGLDSVKEVELHYWSEVLNRSGLATFAFDGPGQGIARRTQPMCDQYERVVSQALTVLARDPRVDRDHIGVFGVSFGGYLACRVAATDPRLSAVVDLAGPFDYSFLRHARPGLQQNFCYAFGVASIDELYEQIEPTGLQVLPAPACPLLVVHGRQDQSIPYEHAEQIWQWGRNGGELQSFADGDHVCTNRFNEVTALVADWFTTQLMPHQPPVLQDCIYGGER